MKNFIIVFLCFITFNLYAQEEVLNEEYALMISKGRISIEGDKYDTLLLGTPMDPMGDDDNDGIKNKDEIYIYTKNGKEYIGYRSHPKLEDTDGDGLIDSQDTEPLKWNVSARDMAMLQELAYREDDYIRTVLDETIDNNVLSLHEGRREYRMMHRELAPYWKLVESYHYGSGFDAVLLQFDSPFPFLQNGSVHVLAIRGTDSTGDGDLKSDASIALAGVPSQYYDIESVFSGYRNNPNIKELYTTGHSLGGYLAQAFAAKARINSYNVFKKAYTFNAPNLRANVFQSGWFKDIRDKSYEISNNGDSKHYATDNDGVTNGTGRMPNYTSVGSTANGHGSRSYFEKKIGDRNDFQVGKRNTMDGDGYVDPNLSKLKFIELERDKHIISSVLIVKYVGENVIAQDILSAIRFIPRKGNPPYTGKFSINVENEPEVVSINETPRDVPFIVEVVFPDKGTGDVEMLVSYELDTRQLPNLKTKLLEELERVNTTSLTDKPVQASTDLNEDRVVLETLRNKLSMLIDKSPIEEYRKYTQAKVNELITEVENKILESKKIRKKIEITPSINKVEEEDVNLSGTGVNSSKVVVGYKGNKVGETIINNGFMVSIPIVKAGEVLVVKAEYMDTELGVIESYPVNAIVQKFLPLPGTVGINIDIPRATLDIRKSDDALPEQVQGVLFPNFTTEERETFKGVKEGTMIFNTTKKCLEIYTSEQKWKCLGAN